MEALQFFMHKKVVILHEENSALEAAKAMTVHRMGCVLVVDKVGEPAGIVTDRDLMKILAKEGSPQTQLGKFMSRNLQMVEDSGSLKDVIQIMKQFGVRRVPVIAQHGKKRKCVGIVTLDDLLARQELDPSEIAQIIKAQIFSTYAEGAIVPVDREVFVSHLRKHFNRPDPVLFEFAKTVFETIFKRMHYSSAVQFMLQLPREFQDIFVQLPAGPDRQITALTLIDDVARILSLNPQEVPAALRTLWAVLDQFGDSQQLENALLHMPGDVQDLFLVSHPLRFLEIEP